MGANNKRVQQLTGLANRALDLLNERQQIPPGFDTELDDFLQHASTISNISSIARDTVIRLDKVGCALWNAATNLLGESNEIVEQQYSSRLRVLFRALAFYMIDIAFNVATKRVKTQDQIIRHFKLGLKACRCSLESSQIVLALKILERISEHVLSISQDDSALVCMSIKDDENTKLTPLQSFTVEFYLLRILHALKSDRLDLAEHFYNKVATRTFNKSAELAEKAADLYCEIGQVLMKKENTDAAIRWLQRALKALNTADIEQLSPEADELRLTAVVVLVDALLSTNDTSRRLEARALVDELCADYGLSNRLVVKGMKFKVIASSEPVNITDLRDVVSRMVRSVVLTEHNFKVVLQKIHELRKFSIHDACSAIEEYITIRLLPDLGATQTAVTDIRTWIEKCCITYALFATGDDLSSDDRLLVGLEHVLQVVHQHFRNCFSSQATYTVQTLLWKATGDSNNSNVERWCELLRHPLFNGAGQLNQARIARKTMTLAMSKGNFERARLVFHEMPPSSQNESITRYLTFKLAVYTLDHELALESLGVISKGAHNEPKFLYACVLEAQQSSMRTIAVAALQSLLDTQPSGIHLPSLFRCTARLLVGELDNVSADKGAVASAIIRVFEDAAKHTNALRSDSKDHWEAEIKWWSKNAYNLSIRLCSEIRPELLLRLLTACNTFFDSYPGNQTEFSSRRQLCQFILASASIVLARSFEEGHESAMNAYLDARTAIARFKSLSSSSTREYVDKPSTKRLQQRLFELQKFDLECILQLQAWDDLDPALITCLELGDKKNDNDNDIVMIDRWDTLADILLIIHERTSRAALRNNSNTHTYILRLLDGIVNDTWKRQKDIERAARWLRLSFSMALENESHDNNNNLHPLNYAETTTLTTTTTNEPSFLSSSSSSLFFATKLLDQAALMAAKHQSRRDNPFPEPELQWIAITAFNKAIDILSSPFSPSSFPIDDPNPRGTQTQTPNAAESAAEGWITGALELARYAGDNGALHANLSRRRDMMRERIRAWREERGMGK